jgi:hypothetical protein
MNKKYNSENIVLNIDGKECPVIKIDLNMNEPIFNETKYYIKFIKLNKHITLQYIDRKKDKNIFLRAEIPYLIKSYLYSDSEIIKVGLYAPIKGILDIIEKTGYGNKIEYELVENDIEKMRL